ncbi:SDR family NAD(P)-dependent oxidoreductase [Bradyrhizobium sp. 141]|uniref:SDR family NAD(P)-dependent oxidoreductase n=1 Tax=Bradyrhizobium sp. 141 TaxID=2782617 RepID=UPI001FFA0A08|nr:SDR family NAD(P)-dependent oxidoreductase [Bradyrhizobium sp. 141]MCK1721504.1 SDR family NAD(P)-dependent oxidoreductase [Bradyrhizobium sp. 141]
MSRKTRGVALITGASSGIGLATARALRRDGFRVFGTSRKPAANTSDGVTMLVCDVTDEPSVQAVVDDVEMGDAPEVVADMVVKAATAATPRRRYTAGKVARQVSLMRRFLPESFVDRGLRKYNRLPLELTSPVLSTSPASQAV